MAIFKKFVAKVQSLLVVNKFDFPVSGIVSFKELATNLKIPTKTIVNELSIVEADEKLQSKLDVKAKRTSMESSSYHGKLLVKK